VESPGYATPALKPASTIGLGYRPGTALRYLTYAHFFYSTYQYCGAGAEIKLPPGAGAEITNCGSLYLSKTLRNFIEKKSWLLKNFL
jgi:hypothetical protein